MPDTTIENLYTLYFSKVFRGASPAAGRESDYIKFIKAFYKGNWMADGWQEQTDDAVRAAGPSIRQPMNKLGQRICGEWAKPNDVRTVTTNHLKQWGKAARDTPTIASVEQQIIIVERMIPKPLVAVHVFEGLRM